MSLSLTTIGKNYSLKRHMRVFHEDLEPHNDDPGGGGAKLCDVCGDGFDSLTQLLVHKKNAHGLTRTPKHIKHRKFKCPQCPKELVGVHGLKTHIKSVHEKKRDYMCNECGKCFAQLISLKTHVKHVHMGVQRQGCLITRWRHFVLLHSRFESYLSLGACARDNY